jgi:transposase
MPRGTQFIHGTEYVFESDSRWNAEKKYGTHKRRYIGKMVEGIFVPNEKHQLLAALKEAKEAQPGLASSTASSRLFCGATALLDGIGAKLGIADDLKACFPDSWKELLSIAYYLILEDRNPLSRFPRWASNHRHPCGTNIPSQRSSELFGTIGEDAKQRFFLLQTRRRMETEYLAYDTTSISSYSTMLKQVRYGRNKDHDPLPQINLALLFGQDSRLPVYYRKLPGNISDVSTIKNLLADLAILSFEKVKLVMDRGFYSEDNINSLYQHHYKFLISAKKSLALVQVVLNEVRDTMRSRTHYDSNFKINYHSQTAEWSYKETKKRSGIVETGTRRLYLHLYYNDQRAVDDKTAFNALLDSLEEELRTGHHDPDHEKLYRKYYDITTTPVRGVSIVPKQEAIDLAERDYGYFVLMSNDIKDPLDALKLYRSKDLIEKAFGNLKERLNMRRTSVSSEQNLEGKLFVQFLALMYLSYITTQMHDSGLFKDHTLYDLLDDLDVIECFERPGQKATIGEITKKQKALYGSLDVAVPA